METLESLSPTSPKQLQIFDLYFLGYLILKEYPITLAGQEDRVFGVVDSSPALNVLMASYHSNDLVPISDYIAAYKSLRAKVFRTRGRAR